MDPAKKIMIIDDEVDLCLLMRNYLMNRQFQVCYATSLREGISKLNAFMPDILFLDNNLPDGIGWERTGEILAQHPGMKLFLMSGYQPNLPAGIPAERFAIIPKPISFQDLEQACWNELHQP